MERNIIYSISSNPGKFGTTIHNAGFEAIKKNYIYKAIKIKDLKKTIEAFKFLDVKGFSVSMPFKEKVIRYLDKLDNNAKNSGAVNTVLNNKGTLHGYNTDVTGFKKAILKKKISKDCQILILGSGGVSRSTIVSLKMLKFNNITITSRNIKTMNNLKKNYDINTLNWRYRNKHNFDVLINATPIGMNPLSNKMPIDQSIIQKYILIIDYVASPLITRLIKNSKKNNIDYIDGYTLTLNQAFEQFKIYTKTEPPYKVMSKIAKSLL